MMKLTRKAVALAGAAAMMASCNHMKQIKHMPYPETQRTDVVDDYFGTKVADPYRWLEDDNSEATAAWVKAQNAVTQDYLSQIPFRDAIRGRLTQLWNYPKEGIPAKHGDAWYYFYNDGLQNQSVLYRTTAPGAQGEVVLNPNTLSDDGTVALSSVAFSKDGKYCACAVAESGSDWVEIRVMNTADRTFTTDKINWVKFSGAEWAPDSKGFYYSAYDAPEKGVFSSQNQFQKVYYHRLGTPQSADKLIYMDAEHPLRYFSAWPSEDGKWLFVIASEGTSGTEVLYKRVSDPKFRVLLPGFDADYALVECRDDRLYYITNKDAANNALMKVDLNDPSSITAVIPENEKSLLENVTAAGGYFFASYLQDAQSKVVQYGFDGKPVLFTRVDDGIHKPEELIKKIAHGEVPVYHAEGGAAAEDDSSTKDSFGRSLYKNLMNGVSHMLPFVVGGGNMIALAFLLDDYSINPANFGMNTPVAAFFKTVGGAAFGYMLPILAGFIAMSIADRPGLAVGFAGGVLAMNGTNFTDLAAGSTTGISGGFLAALLAGFAAGYIVQFLKKITEKLPASLNGIRPMLIYPLGGILIVGAVMCGINPIMGMINTAMTDWLNALGGSSKVLLGAIVAGMMRVDKGGPVNKAAYVFGTAALASGNYEVMAAVMVGGMVPPIAIALSTTFCHRKWTLDERRNGIANYVMGLCFVAEGAIPYAAADPLRVLPSCVVGSAVAGALSMTFGCALRAPHGGIFVFAVVGNWLMYLVSLVAGAMVGMLMLALLKKKRTAAK